MKRLILAYLTAILCWSCENEIAWLNLDESPSLIVNAILSEQRTDNEIHLYLTGSYETTCISNGIVTLYINGELAETITASYDSHRDFRKRYYYPVKSHFNAGDRVRLEAETEDGEYKAWAETKVPTPPKVTKIDTLSVFLKEYMEAISYDPYYQIKFHLEEQSEDKEQYFRILAGVCTSKEYTLTFRDWIHLPGGMGEYVTTVKDTTIIDEAYQLITREDLALNDGKPQVSDDYIGFIPETQNHFLVFSNQYFNNKRYIMTVNAPKNDTREIPPTSWGDGVYPEKVQFNSARLEMVYHLIAISKEEFYYLKGLGLRMDIDMDEPFFFEPNIIPGNIHGGTGIFAIENWNTGKMRLD